MKTGFILSCLLAAAAITGAERPEDFTHTGMLELWRSRSAGRNLALGKKVTLQPRANNNASGETTVLTDGIVDERNTQAIWRGGGAIQWRAPKNKMIIDFGQPEVVGKVVWRVLAGEPPLYTGPEKIRLYGSDDGVHGMLLAEQQLWSDDYAGDNCYTLPVLPPNSKGVYRRYAYPLELDAGNYRIRYLIVEFEQSRPAFCTSDEMAVLEGSAPGRPLTGLPMENLLISGIHIFSPEARLPLVPGFHLPLFITQIDMRPDPSRPVKYYFKLPPGITLESRYAVTRSGDWQVVSMPTGGHTYLKYHIGPFYFLYDGSSGRETREVEYYADDGEGNRQDIQKLELYPAAFPEPFTLKKLTAGIGWIFENEHQLWPGFYECYRRMGFNTIATFPRTWPEYRNPDSWDRLLEAPDAAALSRHGRNVAGFREKGFRIVYMDSPFHVLNWDQNNDKEEYQCQTPKRSKTLNSICLAYRGKYFEQELKRTRAMLKAIGGADYLMWDCELLSTSLSAGGDCPRCRERMRRDGYRTPEEFGAAMSREIFNLLNDGIRKTAAESKLPVPQIGMYNVDAARIYSRTLRMTRQQRLFDFQNPSLYTNRASRVHDHLRSCENALPEVASIPWLTTATYGYVRPVEARLAVWEAFLNGSKGITYYQFEDFNPAHCVEVSRALSAIAPFEDLIAEGTAAHGEFTVNPSGIRVSARKYGGRALLLLVNSAAEPVTARWTHTGGVSGTVIVPERDGILIPVEL